MKALALSPALQTACRFNDRRDSERHLSAAFYCDSESVDRTFRVVSAISATCISTTSLQQLPAGTVFNL